MTHKFLVLLFLILPITLMADPQDPVKIFGRWVADKGDKTELAIGFDIEEKGFRVYRDSLKLKINGQEQKDASFPAGTKRFDTFQKKEKEIYSQKTEWAVFIPKNSKSESTEIALTYRACNDVNCHFPKTKTIKILAGGKEVRASLSESFTQLWSALFDSGSSQAKTIAENHFLFAILLCFLSGILTSLTPCVYPMIPVTINILARANTTTTAASTRKFNPRAFRLASIYVAGMCTTYSILGVISGLSGALFGSFMSSPWMLGFITILFFVFALGQLGLFKMALPGAVQTLLGRIGNAENPLGIFAMGLISGLIVSPCVGPILAGIIAFVFESSNAFLGFIYFFSFSLGLGILFLLIGGFSGLLATLPRSGNWMVRINRILAALLLVASFYYGALWFKKMGWIGAPLSTPGQGIAWRSDEQQALEYAVQNKLPVVIDFTAEWCEACHELEATVFQDPRVIEKMKHVVPLRIDVTQENEQNARILNRYVVLSLPTVVYINRQGEVLDEPRLFGTFSSAQFLSSLDELMNL